MTSTYDARAVQQQALDIASDDSLSYGSQQSKLAHLVEQASHDLPTVEKLVRVSRLITSACGGKEANMRAVEEDFHTSVLLVYEQALENFDSHNPEQVAWRDSLRGYVRRDAGPYFCKLSRSVKRIVQPKKPVELIAHRLYVSDDSELRTTSLTDLQLLREKAAKGLASAAGDREAYEDIVRITNAEMRKRNQIAGKAHEMRTLRRKLADLSQAQRKEEQLRSGSEVSEALDVIAGRKETPEADVVYLNRHSLARAKVPKPYAVSVLDVHVEARDGPVVPPTGYVPPAPEEKEAKPTGPSGFSKVPTARAKDFEPVPPREGDSSEKQYELYTPEDEPSVSARKKEKLVLRGLDERLERVSFIGGLVGGDGDFSILSEDSLPYVDSGIEKTYVGVAPAPEDDVPSLITTPQIKVLPIDEEMSLATKDLLPVLEEEQNGSLLRPGVSSADALQQSLEEKFGEETPLPRSYESLLDDDHTAHLENMMGSEVYKLQEAEEDIPEVSNSILQSAVSQSAKLKPLKEKEDITGRFDVTSSSDYKQVPSTTPSDAISQSMIVSVEDKAPKYSTEEMELTDADIVADSPVAPLKPVNTAPGRSEVVASEGKDTQASGLFRNPSLENRLNEDSIPLLSSSVLVSEEVQGYSQELGEGVIPGGIIAEVPTPPPIEEHHYEPLDEPVSSPPPLPTVATQIVPPPKKPRRTLGERLRSFGQKIKGMGKSYDNLPKWKKYGLTAVLSLGLMGGVTGGFYALSSRTSSEANKAALVQAANATQMANPSTPKVIPLEPKKPAVIYAPAPDAGVQAPTVVPQVKPDTYVPKPDAQVPKAQAPDAGAKADLDEYALAELRAKKKIERMRREREHNRRAQEFKNFLEKKK